MEWLLFLLSFAVAFSAGAAEAPSQETTKVSLPSCFGELTEVPLPESLDWANDVRWLGEQEVAISAYKAGVVRLRLDHPGEPPGTEVAQGEKRTATGSPWSLGSSEKFLVVGSWMFAVGWKARGASDLESEDYFEFIWDLDVRGDRLLVLGMRKTEDGTGYEEEGAFVWLGSLGEPNLKSMRPLAFSTHGGRGRAMGGCGLVGTGAARFLDDGSFVVAPVAAPGVLLFRADGRLARTWQSEEFGFDSGCEVNEEYSRRLGIDLALRMEWINQRSVVDDILPLGGDRFGLLVRRHEAGMTRWQMEIADSHGRIGACKVPIAVNNRWAHLRADSRGERAVLLRFARTEQRYPPQPAIPPRLIVAPIKGTAYAKPNTPQVGNNQEETGKP